MRFANNLFEPIWKQATSDDDLQITMAEDISMTARFYDMARKT